MGDDSRDAVTEVASPTGGASSPRAPALPARFRVERLLGRGGQAEVWLAHDDELSEDVAVKVFRPDLDAVARERLRREVRLGRTLVHPRLVRVYELLDAGDRLAIVQQYVSGGSLAEEIRRGPLPLPRVLRIADEVLDALAHLHREGVVHRDVKPSNLLVGADGRVVLADFGLARPLAAGDLTRTALAVGTPGFMSPEQLRGDAPGPASDLYGLGATLFELVSGRAPFEGDSAFEVARQHMSTPAPPLRKLRRDCPDWLERFVARLLEKRPADRFASAGAAREALRARRTRLGRRALGRRLAWGAALLLLTFGILALLGWRSRLSARQKLAFEVAGHAVKAIGGDRTVVWQRRFRDPVLETRSVDLDGDGRSEVALATAPALGSAKDREGPSAVVVLDAGGRELTRFQPEQGLRSDWTFGILPSFRPRLEVVSFPWEGPRQTLFARSHHRWLYPSSLAVYWTDRSQWELLLMHSGVIVGFLALPEGPPGRVAFSGVNNELGWLAVAGELELALPPPGTQGNERFVWISSRGTTVERPGVVLRWYTFCGPPLGAGPGLTRREDGRLVFGDAETRYELDRFGNPAESPNLGRDLRPQRVAFLREVGIVYGNAETRGLQATRERAARIRDQLSALLVEEPYRGVLGLAEGLGLARAGDAPAARAVLARAAEETSYDDLVYRLAQLEAIGGELRKAEARLVPLVGKSGRTFDVQMLLIRLYVELRSPELLQRQAASLGGFSNERRGERIASHLTRAHLLWDEVTEADTRAESWVYVPEADALACLSRWRLGRTLPTDPDAMDRAARLSPEAATEYRIARAASLLGLGRVAEADAELARTIAGAEIEMRHDFLLWQTIQLARGLRAKTLLAAGQRGMATDLARRLVATGRPRLLPRILAEEVLRDAGKR